MDGSLRPEVPDALTHSIRTPSTDRALVELVYLGARETSNETVDTVYLELGIVRTTR
jgi:hypothetical protein